MRILLLNPPHPSIGSRIPDEHLPPLGLLSLGGPLLDAGHEVRLLDADVDNQPVTGIVAAVCASAPQLVLIGHSGSTSGHPSACAAAAAIRAALPEVWIIYGGVYPTYHWQDILRRHPEFDILVRGEGEATIVSLVHALASAAPLAGVYGIVCRATTISGPRRTAATGDPLATAPADTIRDLDANRIGWELIDHTRYSYWGNRRAVVVQFSRGCPHHCTYCGQQPFWRRWRHRDPVRFADEIARLHREHGVEVFNFADENPTASRAAWLAFLHALIAERVPVVLVASTRADDIVRDADILHLYKQAGVARFLMGLESVDAATLARIGKGASTTTDREAIRLLRRHGILSMVGCVAGFATETGHDHWRTLRTLISYDPDMVQVVYATPHRWTPWYQEVAGQRVVQTDLSRWDYKHQVLATAGMPPWRLFLWMKSIEAAIQLRPRALGRMLAHPDRGLRAAIRWYYRVGRRVWFHEVWGFLVRDRRTRHGPTVAAFWDGDPA
jgi:anaerobic magnesium-protoporphyrin IX monomethyl ester cyclase